jgi:hypothetical protein
VTKIPCFTLPNRWPNSSSISRHEESNVQLCKNYSQVFFKETLLRINTRMFSAIDFRTTAWVGDALGWETLSGGLLLLGGQSCLAAPRLIEFEHDRLTGIKPCK